MTRKINWPAGLSLSFRKPGRAQRTPLTKRFAKGLLQVMNPARTHRSKAARRSGRRNPVGLALSGLVAAVLSLCLFNAEAAVQVGSVAVQDLAGRTANPLSSDSARALVFVFLSVECPICNQYAPELTRLQEQFGTNGIRFELIYPEADETAEVIRKSAREYRLGMEQFRDPEHALVRAAGAKVTPEAAIFVPGRGFVYCGRIDNRYVQLGVARLEATEHDLRDALQALLAGKPIGPAKPAVGCFISTAK